MLPPDQRLKSPADFRGCFREGKAAAARMVVVHVRRPATQNPLEVTRVGFVVSKKVGNAVQRNRVKRRLRHIARELRSPFVADVVVRALPGAATAGAELSSDVRSAWSRAFRKA
ncbi:ribonuclease P protein component [Tessaracoccus sp. OH4464_COT-324]|nr:ribonuclease P protein component [Tessaracoccus sp. OH4464_COT-324]RRD46126.1 ribonuclease P protein component [Tessaracoccus sp. OH4464_COT-324]